MQTVIKLEPITTDIKRVAGAGHKIVVQTALSDVSDVNRDDFWKEVGECDETR